MSNPIIHPERFPIYLPHQVFEAGTLIQTLPTKEGMTFEVESDRFKQDLPVEAKINIAGTDFHIIGKVVEFRPDERVKIEGSSHIGTVALWFDLFREKNGTRVDIGVDIHHHLFAKASEPFVRHHIKHKVLPIYAKSYKRNIIDYIIDNDRSTHKRAS